MQENLRLKQSQLNYINNWKKNTKKEHIVLVIGSVGSTGQKWSEVYS